LFLRDPVDVEDMLMDLEDSISNVNDVGEALAGQMDTGLGLDEDDLLAELDDIGEEADAEAAARSQAEYEREILGPAPVAPAPLPRVPTDPVMIEPALPTVPTTVAALPTVPTTVAVDDEAFAKLEASMAI